METDIIVILDRSGSMESIRTDVIGGFNRFVREQRAIPGPCCLTLTQFDSEAIDTVYSRKELAYVPELEFQPRGMTPLLDAIGKTVSKFASTSNKVLVVIITDGQENASHEWTKPSIKSMLEEKQKLGWAVIYLGANVDAFAEAQALGISAGTTSGYTANTVGTAAAFTSSSGSATRYRSGQSAVLTDEERKKLQGNWIDPTTTGSGK